VIWNLAELELEVGTDHPEGRRFSGRSLTDEAGAQLTGLSVYEVPAGEGHWPYHFEIPEEEWLLVIEGTLVLRTPDGERTMNAGDVACFVAGAAGAHGVLRNESGAPVRFAMPSSNAKYGGACVYPDSNKVSIATRDFRHRGYLGDAVPYWEGET
jgi:uncharacterized cupin superfamily protein